MSSTSRLSAPAGKYHPESYRFVFAALQYTQEKLNRSIPVDDCAEADDVGGHISGGELLEGIREYALLEFGLMARTVFESWNVRVTRDFGEIVFDLVEQGQMRATEQDCIEDFDGVFDFGQALDCEYEISTSRFL